MAQPIPLESAVVRRFTKLLRDSGAWVTKTDGRGLPDLLVAYRGLFVAMEVKRPGGSHPLTPKQQHVLMRIRKAGGVAIVARTNEDVQRVLNVIDMAIADGKSIDHAAHTLNRVALA